MSYLLLIGLLFILLVLIILKNKDHNIEGFRVSNENQKYFLIRCSKDKNINNIRDISIGTKIGYKSLKELDVFKQIISNLQVAENIVDSFTYKKMEKEDFNKVDIFIDIDVIDETKNNYVLYYDKKDTQNKYELAYVNGSYTFLIRDLYKDDKNPKYKYVYESEKHKIGTETTFVISGKFEGTYKQISQDTDEIILKRKKINDLNVNVGETVLIENQEHDKMEGIYTVKNVGNTIMMRKKVTPLNTEYVCIDEKFKEQTSYRTEYSCEDELDTVGKKKDIKMHWDKRCVRDFECPWYKEDSKYGCNNGYCQTPKNVRQVSYRYYEGMKKPESSLKTPKESEQDVDFLETNLIIAPNVPYYEYSLDVFRTKIKTFEFSYDMKNENIVERINEYLKLERKFRLIHSIKTNETSSFVIHRINSPFGFYVTKEASKLTVKGIVKDETIFELIDLNNI